MSKKYLGIVLARGGSKRVPKKNLLPLDGIPLIEYTFKAGQESKYIDRLIVSSDSDEILQLAEGYSVERLKRPERLAGDETSSLDAIVHVLETYTDYEYVILLQPTSPLRKTLHIDEAIELLEVKKADAVVSVCTMEHSPLWANTLDETLSMRGFLREEVLGKRSQDLEQFYRLNGAIYICKTTKLLEEKSFFLKDKIFAYVMSRESSIDIDELIDFNMAEFILNKQINKDIK